MLHEPAGHVRVTHVVNRGNLTCKERWAAKMAGLSGQYHRRARVMTKWTLQVAKNRLSETERQASDEGPHVMAGAHQSFRQVGADEAVCSGDEDFLHSYHFLRIKAHPRYAPL